MYKFCGLVKSELDNLSQKMNCVNDVVAFVILLEVGMCNAE